MHRGGATAEYYTRYLTEADGEQPGVWAGRQADLLSLAGEVTTDDLQALLEGRDPITGTPMGNPFVDRVHKSGKVMHWVAGFDATFSAPKSLSVWWALSGDEGLAEGHDVAVRAVVDAVERYGSATRVRSNGRRLHPDSQGLTAAVFRQTTSRLDDPQLHSHVMIYSKVQTDDGRWLALDARVLKGYQRALGGLYQSVLRAELTARYGVAFGRSARARPRSPASPRSCWRSSPNAPSRSSARSRPSWPSSTFVRGVTRHRKNAGRWDGRQRRTPVVTRPESVSPI